MSPTSPATHPTAPNGLNPRVPADGPRCSDDARSVDEPLAGTAPRALGWMLIEVPGAWGRQALTESALDPAVGAELARRIADLDVKVVLIRRPGRHPRGDTDRRVILAHTGARPWLRTTTVTRDAELLAVDPATTLDPTPPDGRDTTALDGPLWLVCTHARRDRCCASYGRPVADTLATLHPEATWEVSHIGGHRFAANLLTLPTGLVFGGLDVTSAAAVVAEWQAGTIDLATLRGRSSASREGQAAEIAARTHLGVAGLDVATTVHAPDDDTDTAVWRVALDEHHLDVEVARAALGRPRLLSCDAETLEDPDGVVVRGVTERR